MRSSAYWGDYVAAHETGAVEARRLGDVLDDPFGPSVGEAWAVFRRPIYDYVTAPLIVAGVAGAIALWRRNPRLLAVLLAWIAVPFAAALLFPTFPFPRHVMYVLPPAVVLIAYGAVVAVRWARRTLPRRWATAACAFAGAVALAPALLFDARVLAHPDTVRYPGQDDFQYVTGFAAAARGRRWPIPCASSAPAGGT